MPPLSKEKLIETMNSSKWTIQVFNGLPLYLTVVGVDSGWMLKEKLSVNYSHFLLLISEDKVAEYYYDEADFIKIGEAFYKKYSRIEEIEELIRLYKDEFEKHLAAAKKNEPADDEERLLDALKEMVKLMTHATSYTHMIEGVEFYTEKKLRALLTEKNISEDEFGILCSPPSVSNFFSSQQELWKIKNNPGNTSLVQDYIKNYSWCDATYIGCPALKQDEVVRRATAIQNPPIFADHSRAKKEIIERLKISAEAVFLIRVIELTTLWHDERKKNILKIIQKADAVLNSLALKINLAAEAIKYCLYSELTMQNLRNPEFIEKLQSRNKGMALYATSEQNVIFTGDDYNFIVGELNSGSKEAEEISGVVASRGQATGRVVICRSIVDLERVQAGDILVASMTRPEFMPAMQRAAAFITDEGGLTCHAAIISRELSKPCIIGTKNATKILRDGQTVAVDANAGKITVL